MVENIKPMSVGGQAIVEEGEIEEVDRLQSELERVSEEAHSITVETEEDYYEAVEYLERLDSVFGVIESIIERFREPAYEYYKSILNEKKKILEPGEESKRHIRDELERYALRKEEEARGGGSQSAEAVSGETEGYTIDDAKEALSEGNTALAERIIAELEGDDEDGVPETDNIHYRDKYTASLDEPEDEAIVKVAEAVVNGDAPADLLHLNTIRANELARTLKHKMNIPGLSVEHDKTVVLRRD